MNRPAMKVLRPADRDEWLAVLRECDGHDFYHLPQYHALAEDQGEGEGRLFVYRENGCVIALPLLLRPLDGILGIESAGERRYDASSVYGYAGPVASRAEIPAATVASFQGALQETLRALGVVTAFSRLHPLFKQKPLLEGIGEYRVHGQTVSVDLTLPPEGQLAQYRSGHKGSIKKLQREGIVCIRDETKRHLPEFISIYHETMRRVNADGSYFFGEGYFLKLAEELGDMLQLFVVMAGETVAAGGLFIQCNGILQYHLSGARGIFQSSSPTTSMLDTARLWGNAIGARVLHLGGGVGSQYDSLFRFKAGFSDCRHDFGTWRWIVIPELYRELCDGRWRLDEWNGAQAASADFFPAYRCPAVPRLSVPSAIEVS